ncbi:hypothetical protein BGZ49_008170 [Haplosporangium sp. Z 27]|nr:hypothetical protein BGZ49_008170 [Haplosporangium sp. Z 27]
MDSPSRKVFDTPELRMRIAQFVTLRDALACVTVCKDWADSFNYTVWHTIDFDLQKRFVHLDKDIVSRYGSRIRSIINVEKSTEVQSINNPSINRLSNLKVNVCESVSLQAYCFEILERNSTTISSVGISKKSNRNSFDLFFPIESIFRSTGTNSQFCLETLVFQGITTTRCALSSLLKALPLLTVLDLTNSTILPSLLTDTFEHQKISTLVASPFQMLHSGLPESKQPSLFPHFPNLLQWRVNSGSSPITKNSLKDIRTETSLYCPKLWFLYLDLEGSLAIQLMTQSFQQLYTICVRQDQLSPSVILAILRHSKELTNFTTFLRPQELNDDDEIEAIEYSQAPGWAIQQIPQQCRHLRTLVIPDQEMNMDDVELTLWSCRFLRKLHVRIEALDTREKVERALQLWVDKRAKEKTEQGQEKEDDDYFHYNEYGIKVSKPTDVTLSIEERVANHLLKLRFLTEVWLGTKARHV